MADIVISEFMDDASVASLSASYDTVYDPSLVDKPAELVAHVGDARALIVRNRTQVRGGLLAAAEKLIVVGRLGVGLDNIDVGACKSRGIDVFPAIGSNDVSVAEYVLTAAMLLLRGAYRATDAMIAGNWPRHSLIGREISGQTLGIVGFGAIGRETAQRAVALGMVVVAYDPLVSEDNPVWSSIGVARVGMDHLLAASDVVTLHVPLLDSTRHLINGAAISRMKAGAVLINAARGGIVDELAVAQALRDGRLCGAALDVFEEEPLDAARGAVFAGCPNLLLTPHIAGVTEQSNRRASAMTAENVARVLAARQ